MAVLSIPILNPNESNTYRNEAVWNHSAGTISFNNTTGSESISLAHRGGASLVFGNQVTSEFNPNNRQVFTQGDNFTTVQGSNFTLTYTNREDRTFGDHHFITGSPQFLNNILASRYIEVQAEIAAAQSIPENEIPGTGNNSGIELSGPPVDVQALLKEKEAELTQIAQSMGEGGNLHFLSCKHINIVAGTSPANFDSGNFQKAVREVKGGSTYTGIGFAGVVTDAPALVPQFNEVNTASTIPFGDVTVNAATKINLQAGAGGIDIKSAGSMKFAGTGMTVVGGSQVMVTSPGSVYVTSKYTELKSDGNVNIVAPQANIDSKLTVEQDAVMKGKLAVAGDSTVLGNSYVKAGIAAGAGIVAGGSMIAAGNMQAGGIVSTPSGNSNNWTNVYTVVQTNSATWDAGGGGPPAPSVDEALTVFRAQSANNISVYSTVISNSANWSNTYTTVNANSANYILAGGNSKGAAITIGTNDNFGLNLETNNTTRMSIAAGGLVSIDSIPISRGIGTNSFSIAIGGGLDVNTTGSSNTAIGYNALGNNTTGGSNIAIGASALASSTASTNNVAIGDNAMFFATGDSNIAVGVGTLSLNNGNSNIAVGGGALSQIDGSSGNIGIGIGAGQSVAIPWNDDGSSNYNNVYSNNSILIGNSTKGQEIGQTNQVVIGHNAEGSGSNSTTLNNTSTTLTKINGTAAHVLDVTGRLSVGGTISSSNVIYASGGNSNLWNSTYATVSSLSANNILDGGNTKGANILIGTNDAFNLNLETADTTRMTVTSAGDVGIGTTTPAYKFDVTGSARINGINSVGLTLNKQGSAFDNQILFTELGVTKGSIQNNSAGNFVIGGTNSAITQLGAGNSGTLALVAGGSGTITVSIGGSESMRFLSNGNVGIGTTTPSAKLDVRNAYGGAGLPSSTNGTIRILSTDAAGTAGVGATLSLGGNAANAARNAVTLLGANQSTSGDRGYLGIFTNGTGISTAYGERLRIDSDGSTIINPVNNNNVGVKGLIIRASSGQTGNLTEWQDSSNVGIGAVSSSGSLGIGTTTPSEKLTVAGNISANGTLFVAGVATLQGGIRIPTASSYFGVGTYGTVSETNDGLAYISGNNIKAASSALSGNRVEKVTSGANAAQFIRMRYDQGISLHTGVGAGDNAGTGYADDVNSRLIVNLTGNVGIGNTSPTEKLDVTGNIKVNGITVGKGANAGTTITNTGAGVNSLIAVTTGVDNTGVGYEALKGITTGNYNTAFGRDSLKINNGIYNTAYGAYTMVSNTNGANNVAVGGAVLALNTTGSQNTAVGYLSLNISTSGNFNTAIGYKALYLNKDGIYNVAAGSDCLWSNTTGSFNVGGGYFALGLNTIGTYNIAFGVAALGGIVGNSNRNIAIGTEAGRYTTGSTVLTGASNCIFIGDQVKAGANDASNCIVIGNGITGNGSNTTTINSTAVTTTKINGVSSPAHILDVTGIVRTNNTLFGNLPPAATAGDGARSYITNSTLAYNGTNIGSAAAGGGGNHSPVIVVNGVWVIG